MLRSILGYLFNVSLCHSVSKRGESDGVWKGSVIYIASNTLTTTTLIVNSSLLLSRQSSLYASLAIFHCLPVSFPTSLSPSISSVFLLPAAPLSPGHLFQGAPPLNLGTHILMFPTEARMCVCMHSVAQEEGGSLCSAQLKGRGITGTQTLIKAFQPPMAPLIQS